MSAATAALEQEPPTGSVVAIDWGESRQEVWVSNKANIGNWYTPDIPLRGDVHPTWYDVLARAKGRTLTLLVPADRDNLRNRIRRWRIQGQRGDIRGDRQRAALCQRQLSRRGRR